MATPPSAKRARSSANFPPRVLSRETATEITQKAMSHCLPWDQVMPAAIHDWLEAFAFAHNTRPEFVLMGSIVTTAALMGPNTKVRVRSTYEEPTNIYAICLAHPGAGKSQAFRLSISDPVASLTDPACNMMVDDYTRQGLFKHLKDHDGRALVVQEEMTAFFDLVQKRQLEGTGERQLYCRLYDGGKWIKSTGSMKGSGRAEVLESCVCIGGFLQPIPFVQKQFSLICECNDGFADRILLSTPKPKLLKEAEVTTWVAKLESTGLMSLEEPYASIQKWHTEKVTYTFDEDSMSVYTQFADDIVDIMNNKWDNTAEYANVGNVSKDKRTMVRLSGILHVLYSAILKHLPTPESVLDDISDQEGYVAEKDFSRVILKETAEMSVALTEYFQRQRKIYEEGIEPHLMDRSPSAEAESSPDTQANEEEEVKEHLLLRPGPLTTPRAVYKSIRYSMRTKAKDSLPDILKKFTEEGLGTYLQLNSSESVYFKPEPTDDNEEKVKQHLKKSTWQNYCDSFSKTESPNLISPSQFERLLAKSPNQ